METKLLSIVVDIETLNALKVLIESELTREEKNNLLLKVMPFWASLDAKYKIAESIDEHIGRINPTQSLEGKIEYLEKVNEKQKWQISGLMIKSFFADHLAGLAGLNLRAIASDFVINPNPVLIHGTEKGIGLDFSVSVHNILAIKSNKREKILFLKEPQMPKQNAKKYSCIRTNDNKFSFEKLLSYIQGNGKHLFRISTSIAVNSYKYSLIEPNHFHLTEVPNPIKSDERFFKDIIDLEIDNHFKRDEYNSRLWEMDYLFNQREKFGVTEEKMKEIDRYIKRLEVTK